MDIKTLKNFIIVAENGSICRAARELHMSQPPLTKQMKLLEYELNAQLFHRSSKGVELTEKGKQLYSHAVSLISYNDLILRELMQEDNELIRLGIITSSVQYSLSLIKEFYPQKPVNFEITERNSLELITLLENNMIDIAFIRTPFDMYKPFHYMKLTEDYLVAVGSPSFFKSRSSVIALEELARLPLITVRRWKTFLDGHFRSTKVPVNYKFICDDNRTSLLMAMNSMGVSILPNSLFNDNLPGEILEKKRIKSNAMKTSIYVVYNPVRQFGKYTNIFLEFLSSKSPENNLDI